MAAKPIDASSQSKKKLKAFQFAEGAPDITAGTTDEKENASPATAALDAQKASCKGGEGQQGISNRRTTKPSTALPPSTPATRLPLADLIGNNETARRNPQLLVTPEEHVQWQHSVNDVTPAGALQRKRKRARSSSPATSSQNEASNFFPDHKSPENDTARGLSDLYTAMNDTKVTPNSKTAVDFAHLIEKSSPQSSANAGSISGLRRWASCGAEFPSATKPKRRRTAGAFGDNKLAIVKDLAQLDDKSAGSGSRVGRLLERIQETLAKPTEEVPPEAPSSSSPLPETGRFDHADEVSPLQRLPAAQEQRAGSDPRYVADDSPSGKVATQLHLRSSSEFGDCDIDIDMVETVESQQANHSLVNTDHGGTAPVSPTALAVSSYDIQTAPDAQLEAGKDIELDEFDEDSDIFAADMEIVASMYDKCDKAMEDARDPKQQGPHEQPDRSQRSDTSDALVEALDQVEASATAPPPNAAAKDVITVDSDDDFGSDDIDVEEFAAAEAMATQKVSSGNASQPHVWMSEKPAGVRC